MRILTPETPHLSMRRFCLSANGRIGNKKRLAGIPAPPTGLLFQPRPKSQVSNKQSLGGAGSCPFGNFKCCMVAGLWGRRAGSQNIPKTGLVHSRGLGFHFQIGSNQIYHPGILTSSKQGALWPHKRALQKCKRTVWLVSEQEPARKNWSAW